MVHDSNQICKPRALESDWPEATTRCDMITSHILRTPDPRYFIKKQKASFSVLIQSSVTNVTPSTVMWHHDLPSDKERYLYIYISSCPVLNWMHTTVPSPMFFLLCIEMVWNKLNCSTSLEMNILSKLRDISSQYSADKHWWRSLYDIWWQDQMDLIYAWRHVTSLMRSIIIFWILNK